MMRNKAEGAHVSIKDQKTKIVLVGGGKKAAILLSLLSELDDIDIAALIDNDAASPGGMVANQHGIKTMQGCDDLSGIEADVLIDVADTDAMKSCVDECRPSQVETIGEESASLILRLLEAGKKGRENQKLLDHLSGAYDKIREREMELKESQSHLTETNLELEKHLAEVFFIHEFFKALTSSMSSVADVANLITDGANGILGVELSCVYMYDDGEELQLTGSHGRARSEFREVFKVGEGPIGQCALTHELVNEVRPTGRKSKDSFILSDEIMDTQAAVPLIVQDRLLGVLAIGQTTDRRLDDSELSRLRSIGHMASLAMQNALFSSELERLAVTDRLTELFNHGYFQQRLEVEVSAAKRHNKNLSLLMLDIDNFKEFNDSFGHPKGDQVLKRIASVVAHYCRLEDTVARYGGEEFVVILPGTDTKGAMILAERIRAAVAEEIFEGDREHQQITKTVSIGVASLPEHSDSQSKLIEEADKALYRAKRSGRNRVHEAQTGH